MNWGSIGAFLAMGGYAGFVWGSYGVTALCIVLEIVVLGARHRRMQRELRG
jgi:heme exporter protein D